MDVGGGIGSTSMLLATAFASSSGENGLGLKFLIQDRPVVCEMGEKVNFHFADGGMVCNTYSFL